VNGACCGKSGQCGYSPNECGTGNCLSNCDAKVCFLLCLLLNAHFNIFAYLRLSTHPG
jgi:hypothetical protein